MLGRRSLAVSVLLCWATVTQAQEGMLDLIPHDAGGALAVRNVKELRDKGDKLLKEMKLKHAPRFSFLFPMVYAVVGVSGVVDEGRPAAVVVVSAKSIGAQPVEPGFLESVLRLLVVVVPFRDQDEIGAKFGFRKGELKANQLRKTRPSPNQIGPDVYVRGKHLYLGQNAAAVKHAATARRFTENVSSAQRQQFARADVLLQLGTVVWGKLWEEGILQRAGQVLGERTDPKEKAMADKVVKSMAGIRFGLAGLHLSKVSSSLMAHGRG